MLKGVRRVSSTLSTPGFGADRHTGLDKPNSKATKMTIIEGNAATVTGDWQFQIGKCVSHKDQPLPSLVMGRTRSSKVVEIYGIRSFMWEDENRDRMILGEVLVNVVPGSEPCRGCLLHGTGLCPMLG